MTTLPVGKLSPQLLRQMLASAPQLDPRILVGPGYGLDCAVIDLGSNVLVFKSDPITFATQDIGWYAVQINSNDLATSGATPRWMLVTMLLPEKHTTPDLVNHISQQVHQACQEIGVSVIGGHSEITYGLERPIIIGTMVGEVERSRLVTPRGCQPGDRILLTKGVPIEATAILGREFSEQLQAHLSPDEIFQASQYSHQPGISVLPEALIAAQTGRVNAMHDPTEGGLLAALWELAEASNCQLNFYPERVPVPPLANHICQVFQINPLAAIASGALLIICPPKDALRIKQAVTNSGINIVDIGWVTAGMVSVQAWKGGTKSIMPPPEQDEIAKLFTK